jgi:hypothetical protein
MLSRIVMIGHAPKELVDLIGYNPVIEADVQKIGVQVRCVLQSIADYQGFVDMNREVALEKGPWQKRMLDVQYFLKQNNYSI